MDDSQFQSQFLIEEYKTLKSELLSNVDESIKLEIYAVGASASLFAWLVSQHVYKGVIWFTPLILCLVGFARSFTLLKRIELISKYIADEIEQRKGCPGWETYFQKNRDWLSCSVYLIWVVLVVITGFGPPFLWGW